jgi:hypothetical protein
LSLSARISGESIISSAAKGHVAVCLSPDCVVEVYMDIRDVYCSNGLSRLALDFLIQLVEIIVVLNVRWFGFQDLVNISFGFKEIVVSVRTVPKELRTEVVRIKN